MMGQHDRSEALFYYFRLEDQVPETHLLRLIEKHISLGFVREKLKDSYSDMGRPSIDPELLLRILLIGYLYGITSERKLVEELRMHLAWRWFTGLGFDQEIPHHSTFSKNRHGRFQESKLFEQLFEQIVRQCVEVGLVKGEDLSVDGSFVEANAAKESRIPREQLAEAAQVHHTFQSSYVQSAKSLQSAFSPLLAGVAPPRMACSTSPWAVIRSALTLCAYSCSVVFTSECRSSACTVFGSVLLRTRNDASECRKLWNPKRHEAPSAITPAFTAAGRR